VSNGTGFTSLPLWKSRSLINVKSEFKIDELALNISSKKAIWASGNLRWVTRR
jgi:hypothetical protein